MSPDGSQVAVAALDLEYDVVIWDFARATLSQLTFDPAEDLNPVWTPDGDSIIFSSTRDGATQLYRRDADGGGVAEKLSDRAPSFAGSVSPDGQRFLMIRDSDVEDTVTPELILVKNWSEELQRLVPTD